MFLKSKEDFFMYQIDIFTQLFPLRFKSKRKFRSVLGLLFTIFMIFLGISIFLNSFIELLKRKNFSVIETKTFKSDIEIKLDKIPFYFIISNSNAPIFDNSIINPYMVYLSYDISNNKFQFVPILLEKCIINENISNDIEIDLSVMKNLNAFCPQNNLSEYLLSGKLLHKSYSSLFFIIEKCKFPNKCKSDTEIESQLLNSNIVFIYPETYINHFNRENNLEKKLRFKIFSLTLSQIKKYIFTYSLITYFSDDGIFFNNIKNKTSYMSEDIQFDLSDDSSILFSLEIGAGGIEYKFQRQYTKFPTILSNIFSAISTLNILFQFILSYFSRRMIIIDMINEIFFNDNKIHTKKIKLTNNTENKNEEENIELKDIEITFKKQKKKQPNGNNKSNDNEDNIKNKIVNKEEKNNNSNINENSNINNIDNFLLKINNFLDIKKIYLKIYQFFLVPRCYNKNKNKIVIDICRKDIYEKISLEYIYKNNYSKFKIS